MKTTTNVNRFSNRLSCCLLVVLTAIGILTPASASVTVVNSALQNGGNPNYAIAPMSSQPYSLAAPLDAHGNTNPGVHPPNSKPYGLSYGEWSARWWQWSLQVPAATNPNLDITGAHCAEGQSGHVWFLAGWFPGAHPPIVNRECTIPAGKSVMIPVANTASGAGLLDCDGPPPFDVSCANFVFNGKTGVDGLREEAKVAMDDPGLLGVTVDGVPLSGLTAYRAQSPIFGYSLTTDNIISFLLALYGLPGPEAPGTYYPAVSDGYWVILTPLAPGKHTIHEGPDPAVGITYYLTVVP